MTPGFAGPNVQAVCGLKKKKKMLENPYPFGPYLLGTTYPKAETKPLSV